MYHLSVRRSSLWDFFSSLLHNENRGSLGPCIDSWRYRFVGTFFKRFCGRSNCLKQQKGKGFLRQQPRKKNKNWEKNVEVI